MKFDILSNLPLKCKDSEHYQELSTNTLNENKMKQGWLANEEHS